jgi:hypothetical protein
MGLHDIVACEVRVGVPENNNLIGNIKTTYFNVELMWLAFVEEYVRKLLKPLPFFVLQRKPKRAEFL